MTPRTLSRKIAQLALTKKAHDVLILDVRKLTNVTDFFVICSADSDVQVKAIADAVNDGTDRLGSAPWHTEGVANRQWILLDYVDVVVHVFHRESRKFYALEKLWGDAKIERVLDEPPRKRTSRLTPAVKRA